MNEEILVKIYAVDIVLNVGKTRTYFPKNMDVGIRKQILTSLRKRYSENDIYLAKRTKGKLKYFAQLNNKGELKLI